MPTPLDLLDELNKLEAEFQQHRKAALDAHKQELTAQQQQLQQEILDLQSQIKQVVSQLNEYSNPPMPGSMEAEDIGQQVLVASKQNRKEFDKLVLEILTA